MNSMLLIWGALMAFYQTSQTTYPTVDTSIWESFKSEFGKSYEEKQVDQLRRLIFASNKQLIEQHNENETSFRLGVNHLMDVSPLEVAQMNGFKGEAVRDVKNDHKAQAFLAQILEDDTEPPAEVDWRKVPGRVTRVKNQGQCGSCWAFASTGVLEGQEAVRNPKLLAENGGQLVELSEQNLVDCTAVDYGCSGGVMSDALTQVKKEGGIDTEQLYPYTESQGRCRFNKSAAVFNDAGFAILPSGDEEALKKVVSKFGPVAVAIDASGFKFQFYQEGVYYNRYCHSDLNGLNHGVLVVGYGTDKKHGDYWIVKNSWGPEYGSEGYILMSRNKKNNCGIATIATIPTF